MSTTGVVDQPQPVVCAATPGDPARLVRYDVPQMQHVSEQVHHCAMALTATAAAVADPPQESLLLGAVLSPATAWAVERALWHLTTALPTVWQVHRCSFQLQEISSMVLQLDTAAATQCAGTGHRLGPADAVRTAGQTITTTTARQDTPAHPVVPEILGTSWPMAANHTSLPTTSLLGVLPPVATSDPTGKWAARLATMMAALGKPDRPVHWKQQDSNLGPPVRASTSVAHLLRTNGDLLPPPGPQAATRQGLVRIESVTNSRTGEVAMIVHCPGTFAGGDDRNPFDHISNLHLAGFGRSATSEAITEAIVAEKEMLGLTQHDYPPVLLSGHSQGGLTAMALAQSPELAKHVTITHVVAAGAPVDAFTADRNTAVLAFSHTTDLVPALDADVVAPAPNVTQVISPGPAEPTTNITGHHRVATYVPVAETVTDHPELKEFNHGTDRYFSNGHHITRGYRDYKMSRAAQ